MSNTQYSDEEVARRGEEIYAAQLRSLMEPQRYGQVVIIDVETGDYEVDADSLAANKRALAKRPQAVLYAVRVGFPVVETFRGPSWGKQ